MIDFGFSTQEAEAARVGTIIVDEEGRFIAAKVSDYSRPWATSLTENEDYATSEQMAQHQAGLGWRLVTAPELWGEA